MVQWKKLGEYSVHHLPVWIQSETKVVLVLGCRCLTISWQQVAGEQLRENS